MAASAPRYRAFISYAHADRVAADRLHRRLEGFHMPARLVGQPTPLGPVPPRLHPIFRDRDELPAAGDLSAQLQAALADSAFLILLSSPASARSKWVNAEVETFLKLHGRDRLLALIVATDPADPKRVCFPPALAGIEPIAADGRPGQDGERLALLKLVAGLTGVRLDDLVQRDAQRQAKRARAVAGGASAVALAMGALAFVAVEARDLAERRQAQAEGLVEYMLTDLRRKLEPVGRLEVLDGVGQRALGYYAVQDAGDMDADGLGRRARAQLLVGEVSDLRGDSKAALAAFTEAAESTAELLARDPDNPERIFDHSQSLFWVAIAERQRFNAPAAEARMREYGALTARLAPMDPTNALWQSEHAAGYLNLGVLLLESGRLDEAAAEFKRALPVYEALARADPANRQRHLSLGTAHAWTADAAYHRGLLEEAETGRRREAAIYALLLERDGEDAGVREQLMTVNSQLARIALARGDSRAAHGHASEAVQLAALLAGGDPTNEDYAVDIGITRLMLLRAEAGLSGTLNAGAIEAIARAAEARNAPDLSKRRVAMLASNARAWAAEAHLAAGRLDDARRSAAMAAGLAGKLSAADPLAGDVRNIQARAHLVAAEAWARDGDAARASALLSQASRALAGANDLDALQLRYRAAVAAGDTSTASQIAARLGALGIAVDSAGQAG